MHLLNIVLGVFFSFSLVSGQMAIFGWEPNADIDTSLPPPKDHEGSKVPIRRFSKRSLVSESGIGPLKKRSTSGPNSDSGSSDEPVYGSRDWGIKTARDSVLKGKLESGENYQCSSDYVKKEGGAMPCKLIAAGAKPISLEGYPMGFLKNITVVGLKVENLIAIATGSTETAKHLSRDEKVDFAFLVTGPDYNCDAKFLKAQTVASSLIGPGSVIVSASNTKMEGSGWDVGLDINLSTSPFLPIGSFHVDGSSKYSESYKNSDKITSERTLYAAENVICTPTLLRISVACDVGKVRLITGKNGILHDSKIYNTGIVMVPSTTSPINYFHQNVACIDYRL